MNKYIKWAALAAILAVAVSASPIHVWINGETLTHTDINSNFSHIHNLMVGGHGPRLVNADVNASAAIAHSKLAVPSLVPKLWAIVACTGASCTVDEGYGINSVTRTGLGDYTANITARSNALMLTIAQSTGAGSIDLSCHGFATTSSTVVIKCITASTGAAAESNFSILVMDAT